MAENCPACGEDKPDQRASQADLRLAHAADVMGMARGIRG